MSECLLKKWIDLRVFYYYCYYTDTTAQRHNTEILQAAACLYDASPSSCDYMSPLVTLIIKVALVYVGFSMVQN